METGLVRYDTARRALQEAHTIDEVKDIRDKAEAMRLYAQQAKDNEMASWAAEIKLRAQRKAAAMIDDLQADGEMQSHGGDRKSSSHDVILKPSPADYAEPMELSRWRVEAQVPEDRFEAYIAECNEAGDVPTSAGLRRLGKQEQQRQAQTGLENAELPEGIYNVIVIDPPWPMEKIDRDVRPNQTGFEYPTMSLEDIAAIDVDGIAAEDSHLFCWTTQKFLPAALNSVREWGFRYVCTFVWHKPGGMQPVGLPQYNCEFAIYARKGSPKFVDTKQFNLCFQANRREHSRKPNEFYDTIRRVTDGRRIEVFAREPRIGFDVHGNETSKFDGLQ